jgi:peptide/nickel transport system permease protein
MVFGERLANFRRNMGPQIKELKFTLKRMRSSPLSVAGLSIVLFFVAISILAPVIAPPTPNTDPFLIPYAIDENGRPILNGVPDPPSAQHIFGTTNNKVDLFYGCIWGSIFAFRLGLIVISATLVIGVVLGLIAGYYSGMIDEVIMRFTDIIISFPGLILTMALSVALSQTFSRIDSAMIAITIVGWPGYTRLIRSEVLRVRTEDYIEASKAAGASDARVIGRHILPNAIYPVVIVASLDLGSIVLFAAALSFLGLGTPPRYADWGQLINEARNWLAPQYWWTFLIPGIFITTFVLGWNLLGDAFRDILDPLYRRK